MGPGAIFEIGSYDLLDIIEPMWSEIRKMHGRKSPHFSEELVNKTFQQRKGELLDKSAPGGLWIEVAREDRDMSMIGYCVATVDIEGRGEIDSIFVDEGHRGVGIGTRLMTDALIWLQGLGVEERRLTVIYGNEEVYDFYARFGFYPRTMVLMQRRASGLKSDVQKDI